MTTGLLAGFGSEADMREAGHRLREAGLGRVETHAPKPGQDSASLLPLAMLAGGVGGATFFFLLQVYATTLSYPVDIGGRPDFGWPAFVPMAFEGGMLCAVLSGFVGYLIANRLPRLYAPVDEAPAFRRASRDLFFVALESSDGAALGRARAVLRDLRPVVVEDYGP